jgi:hypothetical protein
MLSDWRNYPYLRWTALLLLALFTLAAVADAAVCQIETDQNGNCLLPCICCYVSGVIYASPTIYTEHAIPLVRAPVPRTLELLVSTIFHPPRA